MPVNDDTHHMSNPTANTPSPTAKLLSHPALHRRSALRDRRPHAVRRHTGRVATRFAVLLAGDVVAIFIAHAVALWAAAQTAFGSAALAGTPLTMGGTRFLFLGLITIAAVFAAGGHSRHRALNQPIRLFGAAAGAVLLNWAGGIARGYLSDLILPMVATTGVLWLSLLIVRQMSEWFLRHVWPAQRGAGAAILIGPPIASRRFEQAIAAPGGDYHVAGYVATERADSDDFLGSVDDLPALIDQHDVEAVVVCADLPVARISIVIEECLHAGCQILYPARAVHVYGVRPTLVWHHDQPFFELGSPVLKARALISKRITDVLVSAILLVLLAPVLAIIAVAVAPRLARLSVLLSGARGTRRPPLSHDQVQDDARGRGQREGGARAPQSDR